MLPMVAALAASILGACAVAEPPAPAPEPAAARPASPAEAEAARLAAGQEARALLAQAETDIQRARSRRALWFKAWESLVLARQAAAVEDNAAVAQHARRASDLAQLGLEQLAYPAVP